VLVYAYRRDASDHPRFHAWLDQLAAAPSSFGYSDIVLSGFVRVVTNPRVFASPTPLEQALAFADDVRTRPNAVPVEPGPRHWSIFEDLCRRAGARGNLVTDAFLAALAIESGSEWITADRDFARFPGLVWRHPLDG
jgi:toxin-antitoxin system PIN domain toxin